MADTQTSWNEEDTQLYQEIASVAVPARAEQIAALLTLLPFNRDDAFRAVEVGCGEGMLSSALLTCFPQATVVALDGSPAMRAQTARQLSSFGPRARIEPFELTATAWQTHLHNVDCVLSSLVIHHLPGQAKRELFAAICNQLSIRGVLLIADLIEPQRPEAQSLFASTWDRITENQSIAETNSDNLFEKFKQIEWNYYRFDDPVDQPSPLFDQLIWLKEAGFAVVDCFWLQAGHAIYGGYKMATGNLADRLLFEEALCVAQDVIRAN